MDGIKTILNRMLGNLNSRYDRSVGGFFYDLFSSISIEIQKLTPDRDKLLNNYFVDTATGNYLTRKCAERGVIRKPAKASTGYVTVKGVEGAEIVKGTIVASELINFKFIENATIPPSGEIKVAVQCERLGVIGNVPSHSITSFPKTMPGLYEVTNELPFDNGFNEETDEALKERYFNYVQTPSTSGNKQEYKNWAMETVGTGGAKVIPRWNGRHTVKVIIISANATGASDELVKEVYDHIESVRPIGADVTVISATEKNISISLNMTIDSVNYNADDVKARVKENLNKYIQSLAFNADYVSYARIGAVILDTDGVTDYSNLKLNDGAENVNISDDEIAVFGGVTFE